MAVTIPFLTSDNNYVLACNVDDETQLLFDVRWNSTEQAWYMDIYEADDTVVVLNVKVVLGVNLGRRSRHEFFDDHIITVVDTSGAGLDAGYDDLNQRILVVVQNAIDLV